MEIGELWKSRTLKGTFRIIGKLEAINGEDEWSSSIFIGHKAERTKDKKRALVGLTSKPKDYPYDWVFLS